MSSISHLSSISQSFHLFHQINTTASSNHLFLIIYLIYLSIIYLLSIYLIYLTIHPSSIHPSVRPSIHPSIHVSTIYLSNNLSVIGKRLGDPPITLCPVGHLQLYVTARTCSHTSLLPQQQPSSQDLCTGFLVLKPSSQTSTWPLAIIPGHLLTSLPIPPELPVCPSLSPPPPNLLGTSC